jgi:hypothetical protein
VSSGLTREFKCLLTRSLFIGSFEKLDWQPSSALAVGTGILGGDRQAGVIAPGLDEADRLGKRGVFLENLGKPRPENNDVAVLPDAFGNRQPVKEIGGQDMGELHRVGGNGRVGEIPASGGDNVLRATADAATNLCRESAQEWLVFGHTGSNRTCGFPAILLSRDSA